MNAETPFLFVQLSAWPNGDRGYITSLRKGQLAALKLNNTGMAVAADLSDPAGMWHPVHPPVTNGIWHLHGGGCYHSSDYAFLTQWKQEVAARLAMEAQRVLYKNTSQSLCRPELTAIVRDDWNPGWKNFHFGYGSIGGICSQKYGGHSPCFGVRLTFDMKIILNGPSSSQLARGFPSGFELGDTTRTQWQPMTLMGVLDDLYTVQLNVTFAPFSSANGSSLLPDAAPAVIRYAWHDYPVMQLYAAESGRPVAPFMIDLPNGNAQKDHALKSDDINTDEGGKLSEEDCGEIGAHQQHLYP
eukprot:SAG31_NODE_5532_length_2472_cov_1.665824_2_plen_300_part_00